jgi:menaquinone-dependent protoporphyrinogen oxidase
LGELQATPTAFLSVSLSQAGVERPNTTTGEHARFLADVQQVLNRFFRETNWYPQHVKAVAGALLYTRYNFLLRFVMKQISRKAGGPNDTTRDHEYTDWAALDRFVAEFTSQFSSPKMVCDYSPVITT